MCMIEGIKEDIKRRCESKSYFKNKRNLINDVLNNWK